MNKFTTTCEQRLHRHRRVRARIHGTPERPRLVVFRSLKHISAQVIDDATGRTLVAASDAQVKSPGPVTIEIARAVGKLLAERAQGVKISKVVFDRGGRTFHGQVKALAEGARQGGLEF